MDAIEFLGIRNQMCGHYGGICLNCPLGMDNNGRHMDCFAMQQQHPLETVVIVKKWKERYKKTRQSELLKLFPRAQIKDGVPNIWPCHIDWMYRCPGTTKTGYPCGECKKKYWLEEINK